MPNPNPKVVVYSVGGSANPIIASINKLKPEFIYFFCSHRSIEVANKIIDDINYQFDSKNKKYKITDDHEDLVVCYKEAEQIFRDLLSMSYNRDEILVDYTGGTKNMSVALALASANYGLEYVYVGGSERTKQGLGIVIDGKENVLQSVNPWIFFAVEERKRLSQLFNNYQFNAACIAIDNILERLDEDNRTLYRQICRIIKGFDLWDHFKYTEASELLNQRELEHLIDLAKVADKTGAKPPGFVNFAEDCMEPAKKLQKISEKIKKSDGNVRNSSVMYDILSNAERRAEKGQYDDAILRLYRALEMIGQVELLRYNVNDSDVKLDNPNLNDQARNWLKTTFKDSKDKSKIKLGLVQKYKLLSLLGKKRGKDYFEMESEFKKVIDQRNRSFLAHGERLLEKKDYENFKLTLYKFIGPKTPNKIIRFPSMKL